MATMVIISSTSQVLLLCLISAYVSAMPAQPTHLVMKTMTVIEKPSCFVLPASGRLSACVEERRKRQVEFQESWSNWGDWNEGARIPQDDLSPQYLETSSEESEDFPPPRESAGEPFLEPSFNPLVNRPQFWDVRKGELLSPLTSVSTVFVTTTWLHTQRLVPECMDPDDKYEPLCPPKQIKKEWGYHGLHGPDKWSEVDITCASGEEESPIEISTNETIFADFAPLDIGDFDKSPKEYLVKNNGHTLVVSVVDSSPPVARNGGLRSEYQFTQMHFHWGETSQDGSEHVINGRRYPMEIHVVNFNRNYSSLPNAVAHRDGLEVLAIFVEISSEDNPVFQPLVEIMDDLIQPNSAKSLPGNSFRLDEFLPDDIGFYRYHGSLTTPNCNQAVYWTMFPKTIKISEDQIEAFRKLRDHTGESQSGNFRPLQKLFGREVFRSF